MSLMALLSFLMMHSIIHRSSQISVPLQQAILSDSCGEIPGCNDMENGKTVCRGVDLGKFDVSSSNCILYCDFQRNVNLVNITFDKESNNVSIDSFNGQLHGNRLTLISSSSHRILNITITADAEIDSISFHFINQEPSVTTSTDNSHSEITTSATIPTIDRSTDNSSDNQTSTNLTPTIIIVAVIIGILLLLVACSIFALTFAVLFKSKKKHQTPLRIHSLQPNTTNMYEASTSSIGEGFKKVDNGCLSLDRPKLPTDPEYATVTEWKQMAGMPEKPVHNPFYDSSFSLDIHKGMAAVQVPQLEWSGSAWDNSIPPCSDTPLRIKKQLSKTDSLQDVSHRGKFDPYDDSCANPKYVVANSVRLRSKGDLTPMPIMNGHSDSFSSYGTSPTSKNYRQMSSPAPPSTPPPPPPSGGSSKSRPSLPSKHSKKITLNRSGSSSAGTRPQGSWHQAEQETSMMSCSIPNGSTDPSPLVRNDHRAIKKTHSNEIVNSEYAVTGFKQYN